MQKGKKLFFGSGTAIVTPFFDNEVDYFSLGNLIDYQINEGTDAIVILGTTGEAPTISEEERGRIISFARERVGGRVPLIVGAGTNSTDSTVRYVKGAHELGADGVLCVTPYYNKPTQDGLFKHYERVAASVDIPIILYNVPTRTGVSLGISALERLAKIDNVIGIKEASGGVSFTEEIIACFKDRFAVYTGNDDLTFSNLALGGDGVVSVASNLFPKKFHTLCTDFKDGKQEKSRETQLKLLPFIKEIFFEPNPVPIKEALYLKGLIRSDEVRLPLVKSTRREELSRLIKEEKI